MSCRRVQSLLSAFVDFELTGSEMLSLRQHLECCPACESEYQSIVSLKRLLNSLPNSRPRPELSTSLEGLSNLNTISIQLLRQQREIRRVFGLAGAAENQRALQRASGQSIGMACALGVLSAWFIVAPAAVAPVASQLESRHPRLNRILIAAGLKQADEMQESSLFRSQPDQNGSLGATDFHSPVTQGIPIDLYNRLPQSPLEYSYDGDLRQQNILNSIPEGFTLLHSVPRIQFYSSKFDASRQQF